MLILKGFNLADFMESNILNIQSRFYGLLSLTMKFKICIYLEVSFWYINVRGYLF